MTDALEINLDELDDMSPEKIAEKIFDKEPMAKCSFEIVGAGYNIRDVFEILLTILMEGFAILNDGLKNVDLENIEKEHITAMTPWFESFGYSIIIGTIVGNNPEEHYCRTLLKNSYNKHLFALNKIEKDYHFFVNSKKYDNNYTSLGDVYSTFDTGKHTFKIYFKSCPMT